MVVTDVGLLSHLLACLGFSGLAAALLSRRQQNSASLWLIGAAITTAAWAGIFVLGARFGSPYDMLISPAETIRTAAWIGFLFSLLANSRDSEGVRGSSSIVIPLGIVIALQLGVELVDDLGVAEVPFDYRPMVAYLFLLSRLATAIGGLVLVHNLYVNAAPSSRWGIRLLCIGLAGLFGYDLNLYTLHLLTAQFNADLFNIRGAANALVVPVLAGSVRRNRLWKLQVSRQVVFHTLSLGAIGGYLMLMSIAAYGLRLVGGDWGRLLQISFLFATLILAAVVIFSGRFRAWARVQINKHFFAYKYDYRQEWLRFINTVSRADAAYGTLPTRVVQAVCEIVDSPGGALYTPGDDGAFEPAARWNYRSAVSGRIEPDSALIRYLAERGRIVDLDELRQGQGDYGNVALPDWLAQSRQAWLMVPLLHIERLTGFIVIERSLAERDLNWEDFDLLRTVGRQAASYIAEQSTQAALLEASKFDEFNRRFAFIMHDIKNLVSQLSLLARNAERHADNPAFRADMVATLQGSVGKMNDLLARLSQHNTGKPDETATIQLTALVGQVVAAKKAAHRALELRAGPEELAVSGDPGRLEQVFAHLIQNAIDASEPSAPVIVSVKQEDGKARIDIIDMGCGMSPVFIRNELFKPFRSTKRGGFGIGAYEAREIVRGMSGRLDVASREGEGTVFSVVLPLASAQVGKMRA